MSIYDSLNEEQKKGVFTTEGPVLLLAGAGSGKTRVLTHRIAYLIDELGVNSYHIMAITFTNKAAGEMKERVERLVGMGADSIWVTTFHSTCVRILRRFADRLGYDNSFTIYDTDDQKSVMKDVCKHLQIDTKQMKERTILSAISSAKNELVGVQEYETQAMEQHLLALGHVSGTDADDCDAYLINTCTVTAVADRKNRTLIRRLRRQQAIHIGGEQLGVGAIL